MAFSCACYAINLMGMLSRGRTLIYALADIYYRGLCEEHETSYFRISSTMSHWSVKCVRNGQSFAATTKQKMQKTPSIQIDIWHMISRHIQK